MSDDSGDFGAFMAGLVVGGLVGAAAALLMAPQSGAETRAEIAARSEELRMASSEQFHQYSDRAGTTIKDTSEQLQERARIVLEEGKSKISSAQGTSKDGDEAIEAATDSEIEEEDV